VALVGARPRGPGGLGLAALLAVACGPQRPACAPESELGKLEAAFLAEALVDCKGFTFDTCPALPKLRAEYRVKVEAWRDCVGEKP